MIQVSVKTMSRTGVLAQLNKLNSRALFSKIKPKINYYAKRNLVPIYRNAYYMYFYQQTNKTRGRIVWKDLTQSRAGTLEIPAYAISMDKSVNPENRFVNLRDKPALRAWVRKNWSLSQSGKGKMSWHATRRPLRATPARLSRVRYKPGNADLMSGYIAIAPRPWLAYANEKVRTRLQKGVNDMTKVAIRDFFIEAGFKQTR